MSRARHIYRRLLRLYPARFREEYAGPLERQFADEYRDALDRIGRVGVWARILADLTVSVPRQRAAELGSDIRYAMRMYRRRPLVTLLAGVGLSLAIGTTTGVFSVVNAVLLRSLPFREPERIVQLRPSHGIDSSRTFHRWRRENTFLDDAVSFDRAQMNVGTPSMSVRALVTETSWNFFETIGARPVAGRGFAEGEDVPGSDSVTVISYGLWQGMFAGDRRAIGSTIRLNGEPMIVIGVAPAWLDFPSRTSAWTPTAFDYRRLPKTGVTAWETIGRLKPGLSAVQAAARFEAELSQSERGSAGRRSGDPPRLIALRDELAGPVREASLVLLAVVAFVLVIACANIAQLLLTQVTERRSELVIRAALGASRARLVQQLVTESLVLALAAASGGLLVARWVCGAMTAALPAALAVQQYTVLDWRVLGFAAALALLTGLVFGVVPALVAGASQPTDATRPQAGSRPAGSASFRRVLIAVQVCATTALLASSMTMGGAFLRLLGTDLGLAVDRVVTMTVSLVGTRRDSEDRRWGYYDEALARLRAAPGAVSAAAVGFLPLGTEMYMGARFRTESGARVGLATVVPVSEDYFRTVGTEVVEGREFTPADATGQEHVAVVNETFARAGGGSRSMLGRKIVTEGGEKSTFTVIGVVRSVRYRGPTVPLMAQVFVPYRRAGFPGLFTFVVRVQGRADAQVASLRDALQSLDRQVPVFAAGTLAARLAQSLSTQRFYTFVVAFLGAFALLLSVLGIYGASWYSVCQRTHEIGVRVAVGASLGRIHAMFLRQSLLPIVAGMAAGVAAALAGGRYLEHLLSTVRRVDSVTCTAAAVVLALVALGAIRTATWRVSRVDPLAALRAE